MTLFWHGGSTVSLVAKKMKAVLNPGEKFPLNDSVKVIAYDRTDSKHSKKEGVLMVDWPGEYDTCGFTFKGVESHGKKGNSIAYSFSTHQGIIAWMGEMSEYPSDEFLEELGEVHVLLLPVGGKDVLSAKDAYRLVEAIEPLVVIPICYGEKREGLAPFLKEMDVKMPTPLKSYELKKSALNEEGQQMELVILEQE